MMVPDTKEVAFKETAEVTALFDTGSLDLPGIQCALTKRAGERLVISFIPAPAETGWLADICAAEDFSELTIQLHAEATPSPQLIDVLTGLSRHPAFAGTKVSLCGVRQGCEMFDAMSHLFDDPVVVLFDPLSAPSFQTFIPVTAFFDPYTSPIARNDRGQDQSVRWLNSFAASGDCAGALARMQLHPVLLPAALQGELDPALFYTLMRKRKDYRFYRIGVEAALEARGKTHLIPAFRDRFRARRVAQPSGAADVQKHAMAARPDRPGSWSRLRAGDTAPTWPSTGGNVWHLQREDDGLRYLSDQWQGITMGFVERDGITLADTPNTALGMAAFGDGLQVERSLERQFPWHVVDARLDGTGPPTGPVAEATLAAERAYADRACLITTLGFGAAQPGITAAEALPEGPGYQALLAQVAAGRAALRAWDKGLFVDRLRLSLLTGAPKTSEQDAARHYAQVATALTHDIANVTLQSRPPCVVVIPHAGSKLDGTSETPLAEARFDIDNPTLQVVIPTPAYPFPLMDGTMATHSAKAATLIDELSVLALRDKQNGAHWSCPALQLATVSHTTVTAQFSTLQGLVLEDGPHGFHVTGGTDLPAITQVEVTSETEVTLELDAPVTQPGAHLSYAWGHRRGSADDDNSANHGALRDGWASKSMAVPGETLHRFALPARVPLHMRS